MNTGMAKPWYRKEMRHPIKIKKNKQRRQASKINSNFSAILVRWFWIKSLHLSVSHSSKSQLLVPFQKMCVEQRQCSRPGNSSSNCYTSQRSSTKASGSCRWNNRLMSSTSQCNMSLQKKHALESHSTSISWSSFPTIVPVILRLCCASLPANRSRTVGKQPSWRWDCFWPMKSGALLGTYYTPACCLPSNYSLSLRKAGPTMGIGPAISFMWTCQVHPRLLRKVLGRPYHDWISGTMVGITLMMRLSAISATSMWTFGWEFCLTQAGTTALKTIWRGLTIGRSTRNSKNFWRSRGWTKEWEDLRVLNVFQWYTVKADGFAE